MVEIRQNSRVRYKSGGPSVGWIVSIDGPNAQVFMDGSMSVVPLNELEPIAAIAEMDLPAFRVALIRRRIEHPLTDQLLSYRASRTQLYYHQFVPVKKILESPDQRLLIADEVGTGKTIEAGLVWAELEARAAQGLQNVWVICPKSLIGKWQEEMLQRFDLRLEQMTSEGLRQALVSLERDGILSPRFAQAVVNLELIRNEEYVNRLDKTTISWDYVIFDEAHHLRNPETLSNSVARFICERSKTVVFLTATPLQTSLDDIVHLMEILGIDVATDPALLEEQIRWDMKLNDLVAMFRKRSPGWKTGLSAILASLERSGGAARPGWHDFRHQIENSDPGVPAERVAVVKAAREIQILSPYMTRTLRSEIDEKRPVRDPITFTAKFSPAEEAFYNEVYQVCLERAQALGTPPGFSTQMPERRTASCCPAVASEILGTGREDEDEEQQASFSPAEIQLLGPLARSVLQSEDDKFQSLVKMLRLLLDPEHGDRVMVFSTFRGTLRYLAGRLRKEGFTLEVIHGGIPPRDEDCREGEKSREKIAAEFRKGGFQLLLASEVAGEGLDFEHCHSVINYDLPWNPMRVEQRIGRCDRIGQKSAKIYVGSLASIGTIEERILRRLYERLQIFESALGDMEIILGEAIASFEKDVFSAGLTPEQQEVRLDRISEAVESIRRQQESVMESSDTFLAGRRLLESDQQAIKDSESQFLSPNEIADFVEARLNVRFPGSIRNLGEGLYEVANSKDLVDALRVLVRDYPSSHYARTEITRFLRRLEQGKIRLTFDATEEGAEFAHIRHPLVLLARRTVRDPLPDIPLARLGTRQRAKPRMIVWALGSFQAYTNRVDLLCASVECESGTCDRISSEEANRLFVSPNAPPKAGPSPGYDLDSLISTAQTYLFGEFEKMAEETKTRNALMMAKAKGNIQASAQRKLQWLERQLARSEVSDNIRNLYRGWRERLESETQLKLDEIDQKGIPQTSLQVIGAALLLPLMGK